LVNLTVCSEIDNRKIPGQPWHISNQQAKRHPLGFYQTYNVTGSDDFVHLWKILGGKNINMVAHAIINDFLRKRFDMEIHTHEAALRLTPEIFKQKYWENCDPAALIWKTAIYNRFQKFALQFPNNIHRDDGLVVIPAICGCTSKDAAEKMCSTGLKIAAKTDPGYYGKGIYFTTNVEYSLKYGNFLVICWIIIGNVYPVIEFPFWGDRKPCSQKFYDNLPVFQKPTLCGQAVKTENGCVYDTHYTIVRAFTDENDNAETAVYVPCEHENVKFDVSFDEIVVFQESHVLPLYLVEKLPLKK